MRRPSCLLVGDRHWLLNVFEVGQKDEVLELLDHAGDVSRNFVEKCRPLIEAARALENELATVDAFLESNPVIKENRVSLTVRQIVGLYVARLEKQHRDKVKLEPKALAEIVESLNVFDGPQKPGPWRDVLKKVRGKHGADGKTEFNADKRRGTLLADFESAILAKKTEPR